MHRILLLLDHRENCHLLESWLSHHYQVLLPNDLPSSEPGQIHSTAAIETSVSSSSWSSPTVSGPFDLCIVDGQALDRLWPWVQASKKDTDPVFLPFLLITPRSNIGMTTRHLWHCVDELIVSPIDKAELQIRIEVLLRTRQLSLSLQQRNAELETAKTELEEAIQHSEQARLELQKSETKFRTLLESAPDPIVIINQRSQIVLVNSETERVFGYCQDELQGASLDRLLPLPHGDTDTSQDTQFPNTQSQTLSKEGTGVDRWARHKNGSLFPVEVRFSPIEIPTDSPQETLHERLTTTIIRDITIRKQVEQEIRTALQTEKELSAMKTRFVSMVSHEFRNPLTSISLTSHLLDQCSEGWSAEKRRDYFQRIKQTVRTMNELLEDVLFIGRADSGKSVFNPTPLNVALFCQELVEELQVHIGNRHQIRLTKEQTEGAVSTSNQPSASATVQLDAKLLRHILINLLTNAAKYSPDGGCIDFVLVQHTTSVSFQIRDEGIGIPKDDQVRLFEAFHRAGNVGTISGTGLGLSIVQRCVELHGGQIEVASEVGLGTTFTVTIPVQP